MGYLKTEILKKILTWHEPELDVEAVVEGNELKKFELHQVIPDEINDPPGDSKLVQVMSTPNIQYLLKLRDTLNTLFSECPEIIPVVPAPDAQNTEEVQQTDSQPNS